MYLVDAARVATRKTKLDSTGSYNIMNHYNEMITIRLKRCTYDNRQIIFMHETMTGPALSNVPNTWETHDQNHLSGWMLVDLIRLRAARKLLTGT